jgi:hypothetical protein
MLGPAATSRLREDDATRDMRRSAGVRVQSVSRLVVSADTLVPVAGVPAAVSETEARQLLKAHSGGPALVVLAHEAEVA